MILLLHLKSGWATFPVSWLKCQCLGIANYIRVSTLPAVTRCFCFPFSLSASAPQQGARSANQKQAHTHKRCERLWHKGIQMRGDCSISYILICWWQDDVCPYTTESTFDTEFKDHRLVNQLLTKMQQINLESYSCIYIYISKMTKCKHQKLSYTMHCPNNPPRLLTRLSTFLYT